MILSHLAGDILVRKRAEVGGASFLYLAAEKSECYFRLLPFLGGKKTYFDESGKKNTCTFCNNSIC